MSLNTTGYGYSMTDLRGDLWTGLRQKPLMAGTGDAVTRSMLHYCRVSVFLAADGRSECLR